MVPAARSFFGPKASIPESVVLWLVVALSLASVWLALWLPDHRQVIRRAYSVIAYAVSQRTRELGIRQALGSTPWQTQELVLGDAIALAGIGLVGGALLDLAVGDRLRAALPGQFRGSGDASRHPRRNRTGGDGRLPCAGAASLASGARRSVAAGVAPLIVRNLPLVALSRPTAREC